MSLITGLRAQVTSAVDGVHAERVALLFLNDGAADSTRQNMEISAPLQTGGKSESNLEGGYSKSWRTQIAAGKAELHIDRFTYQGPMPRQGDKVRALERPGKPFFEVLQVNDRHPTRLVLELGEA